MQTLDDHTLAAPVQPPRGRPAPLDNAAQALEGSHIISMHLQGSFKDMGALVSQAVQGAQDPTYTESYAIWDVASWTAYPGANFKLTFSSPAIVDPMSLVPPGKTGTPYSVTCVYKAIPTQAEINNMGNNPAGSQEQEYRVDNVFPGGGSANGRGYLYRLYQSIGGGKTQITETWVLKNTYEYPSTTVATLASGIAVQRSLKAFLTAVRSDYDAYLSGGGTVPWSTIQFTYTL